MEKIVPRLFLDSNVILDVIERRKDSSIMLLDYIREKNLFCCTSSFAHAELVDVEQEFIHITNMLGKRFTLDELLRHRKKKRLSMEQREDAIERVKKFFEQYKIETWELEQNGWSTVIEVLRDLNVKAPDAIHVATALELRCSLFVTSDEELGKEANKKLTWVRPSQALDILKESHDK